MIKILYLYQLSDHIYFPIKFYLKHLIHLSQNILAKVIINMS